ncbi:hypothetical protein [Olivibacter sitiensis]|uniref:hypothetical protein n=1 Tax=Olivibacter sitiensis TaxID=376470 RepID=UPI00068758FF|nr:hypothetical protein [Olivibacter sitiensis]
MQSCNPNRSPSYSIDQERLVAWCIVPYDSLQRTSMERAKMLHGLGITKLAYDWRDQHIPQFDEEWLALKHYGIQMQAFWMIADGAPAHDSRVQAIFDFLERNHVHTQIWLMLDNIPELNDAKISQEKKVATAVEPIRHIARRAEKLGCQVGLYNHGGWYGEPENQLEIIKHLQLPNIGMVYNFHHAKEQVLRFKQFFPDIQPHLLSLNLAGLKKDDYKHFYTLGEGNLEQDLIAFALGNGYDGPIGIIGHDEKEDARIALEKQMKALNDILQSEP